MASCFLYNRREFIALLGGAAATWPLAARAQQGERMRGIGVLTPFASDDTAQQTHILALAQSGWIDGRNARIDIRWGAGDPERIRRHATELVALAPDVILAVSSAATGPLLHPTRTVPVVFVEVAEPVGAGFVETLAGRAATLRASCCLNTASAPNGWSCSRRLRLA